MGRSPLPAPDQRVAAMRTGAGLVFVARDVRRAARPARDRARREPAAGGGSRGPLASRRDRAGGGPEPGSPLGLADPGRPGDAAGCRTGRSHARLIQARPPAGRDRGPAGADGGAAVRRWRRVTGAASDGSGPGSAAGSACASMCRTARCTGPTATGVPWAGECWAIEAELTPKTTARTVAIMRELLSRTGDYGCLAAEVQVPGRPPRHARAIYLCSPAARPVVARARDALGICRIAGRDPAAARRRGAGAGRGGWPGAPAWRRHDRPVAGLLVAQAILRALARLLGRWRWPRSRSPPRRCPSSRLARSTAAWRQGWLPRRLLAAAAWCGPMVGGLARAGPPAPRRAGRPSRRPRTTPGWSSGSSRGRARRCARPP